MNKRKIKVIMMLVFLGTMQTVQVNAAENITNSNESQVKHVTNEKIHYASGVGKSSPTDVIRFQDLRLVQELNKVLGKSLNSPITVGEMETLTSLDLSNKGIEQWEGLEYAQNLQELNISKNKYTTLYSKEILNKLTKLEKLDMSGLGIYAPIKLDALVNLKYLNISRNGLKDFSFLSKMPGLVELSAEGCQIEEVSALKNLNKLKKLNLSDNKITDISSLSGLINLEELNLGHNKITNINLVKNMVNLKILNLEYNEITEINGVESLNSLINLDIKNNNIKNAKLLAGLTNLKIVNMDANDLQNMDGFDKLPSIEEISVNSNKINDISALSNTITLKKLDAQGNQISDITYLSRLKDLEVLHLYINEIKKVDILKNLTNLTSLTLGQNHITDVSAIKDYRKQFDLWSEAMNQKIILDPIVVKSDEPLEVKTNVVDGNGEIQEVSLGIPSEGTQTLTGNWAESYAADGDKLFGGTVEQEVTFIKTNSPVIEGTKDIIINLGESLDLLKGVSASDVEDGDITSSIVVDDSKVDYNKIGIYEVTYTVTDSDGNTATKTINLTIESDITIPTDPVSPEVTIPKDNEEQLVKTGNQLPLTGLSTLIVAVSVLYVLKRKMIE